LAAGEYEAIMTEVPFYEVLTVMKVVKEGPEWEC
jgi:hypothetical protein